MYKATYAQVKQLIEAGKMSPVVTQLKSKGIQPTGYVIASYRQSGANWAYQIGIYNINGKKYELLTRFGAVEGGHEIYLVDFTTNN